MRRLLLLLLLGLLPPAQAGEKLSVVVEQYAPFAVSKAGKVGGISAEILAEVTKQTGYEFDIQIFPLVRIRELLDKGQADISVAESPLWFDRAKITDFSFSVPYAHVQEYVYFPASKVFPVEKPMDLKGHLVGIHHGYFYAAFDQLFKDGVVKIEEAESSDILLKKMLLGRSEVVFLDNFEFGYTVNKYKLGAENFSRGMKLTDSPVSVMVRNRRKDIIEKINPVLTRLIADGTVKRIIDKYIALK